MHLDTPTPLNFYFAMGTTSLLHIIILIMIIIIVPLANPLSFDYPNFKYGDVNVEGDAYFLKQGVQITVNSIDLNKNNSVGRVTSHKQMLLWDKNSGKLADFRTEFSFVVYAEYNTKYGDGLAFFMADPNLTLFQDVEEGGGLGLVDGNQVLNSTQHSFVAVEFDTFQNPWDPSGLHVGMNFNSMRSKRTKPVFMDIWNRKIYNCSIEYNSSTLILSVLFSGYKNDTIARTHISHKVDLRDYLPESIILGFSAATGNFYEVHSLHSWSFNSTLESDENVISRIPPTNNPNSEKGSRKGMLVGLGIGIGVIVIIFSGIFFTLSWKRTRKEKKELVFDLKSMDDEFQKGTGPKRFCYNELVSATNKFSESEKLGQGGFGGVYKGYLKESNSYVAIKRVSRGSSQGIKEYATEVKIISQLRHRNLVQLIGWCHRKNDLLLVYEFMPNGSLDSHLFSKNSFFLTWQVRYNIALSLASALLYLQEEWEQCVIHRDIKSSNIMLDSSFNAKLGDFGLARLVDHEKGSQTTLVAGTRGYMAPEYFTSGKAYKESDIYSFGIVLLEIASGRKAIDLKAKEGQTNLIEWIWKLYGLGKFLDAADTKLNGLFDEQELERLVVVGLWCAHPDYSFRPCVRQVIQVLKFEAPLPILPDKMPVPTYLSPALKEIFASFSSPFWGQNSVIDMV